MLDNLSSSLSVLLGATISIAFVHALAPDHWLPFVMLAKARNWSGRKVATVSFVAGLAHVGSSIVLGAVGIALGLWATMTDLESARAKLGVFLLIGFGITYAIWGLRHAKRSDHHHLGKALTDKKNVTLWTIFSVFILGPCEPLIPLMFLATSENWFGIVAVTVAFTVVTIVMMVGQALIGHAGIQRVNHSKTERYSHALAGVVIALTGVFLLFLV
ncbi:MAG: hypothetical protein V3U68_02480 [Bacteroidota bacterium]